MSSTNVVPAAQISIAQGTNSPEMLVQFGGVSMLCPNGIVYEKNATLEEDSEDVALSFPVGVTTSVFVFISAITATDLIVKVGTDGAPVSVPAYQGLILYGLTAAQVSLNSELGGQVSYVVGG